MASGSEQQRQQEPGQQREHEAESAVRRRVHAFGDDALGDRDAVALAAALRVGDVSRAEVVDAAIARIRAVDPALNAVAFAAFERAREESWRQGTGFFGGVPTIVKDNSDVQGMPTQQGSSSYVAHAAPADGDWAPDFLGTGLINLGKSQLSEFGFSASAEYVDRPPVRNPWLTSHTSGASSAGSAALVAAGAIPIAHANDGGGSIRIPAACCGLVGLKPSRGRTRSDKVSREMPVKIIADGVVTRSVRDTAVFLREYELRNRNVRLRPIGDVRGPGRKRRRIALVVDSPWQSTDAETAAAVRETATLLESLGHHVEEVAAPVPSYFADDFLIYWAFLALVLTSTGRRGLDRSFDKAGTDNLTRGLARHARRNLHRLPLAITRLNASRLVAERFYRQYDVTLNPTLATVTPELGWLSPAHDYDTIIDRLQAWVAFTPLQNATGQPGISLPAGLNSHQMPIGIHLGSAIGCEARLLELAYELEEARPFPRITERPEG